MANKVKSQSEIDKIVASIVAYTTFLSYYLDPDYMCFRIAVNRIYKMRLQSYQAENPESQIHGLNLIGQIKNIWNQGDLDSFNEREVYIRAVKWVHLNEVPKAQVFLGNCLQKGNTEVQKKITDNPKETVDNVSVDKGGPFDKRLERLFRSATEESDIKIPFSMRYSSTATGGYFSNAAAIKEANIGGGVDGTAHGEDDANKNLAAYQKDLFYTGIPSMINTYSLTRLYGSAGGEYLINKRGQRKWYEVDQAISEQNSAMPGFSALPTTSTLISWGNADPYGRTPYHFTDFVFCKYWNKIENNRLITLRRFAAPILDNLKFPGMDGVTSIDGKENTNTKVLFPPMATAVTYFGKDTGNNLSDLLKFTTGVNWTDVKSDVWQVGAQETTDVEKGPGSLFGSLATMSKVLNVAGGNFKPELLMNSGNLPPDPYKDGPYENRILGPVNRIDSVKKREAGLVFAWSGLDLNFEYNSRPIGGVNPKAILLDILGNFLVLGSASAVFFGGQHRFMANPAKYPFLGGNQGIEKWYSGDPVGWAGKTLEQFITTGKTAVGPSNDSMTGFFDNLFSGKGFSMDNILNSIKSLATTGATKNGLSAYLAEKTAGQVPYLTGMKALLTGEPVGEWHITIGNPLNPIAMIGNLICTGVEVEFGEELGPDDFPTTIKFKVKLDHGMPRDKDALQSIFNRGMGRIYDLPDEFLGTADKQTKVDKYTAKSNITGTAGPIVGFLSNSGTAGGNSGKSATSETSNSGKNSVYASHVKFQTISPNSTIYNDQNVMLRSSYRSVDWVALKSLK